MKMYVRVQVFTNKFRAFSTIGGPHEVPYTWLPDKATLRPT